jgi:SAM-dependent methyltransferase
MASFPDILAPFVPTPHDVVDRMLLLAEVTAADTVYDLGCGDGRIIVAAARKYGARGVGVDVEPGMMEMTLENITQAGVGNLVEFRMQDAQTVDLRPATVIVLYLVQWSMARFEPIILRTCAPGTRIVSHSFAMATWVPEKVERFNDAGGDLRTLFLWRVGA